MIAQDETLLFKMKPLHSFRKKVLKDVSYKILSRHRLLFKAYDLVKQSKNHLLQHNLVSITSRFKMEESSFPLYMQI